jgi:pimeloyl-ACP methyl ester carboxylesterase
VSVRLEVGGGVTLAADLAGPPDAPTVVLLHGGGQTRHAWGGASAALARSNWRTVNIDLRGHGESDWAPDGVYDLDRFSTDVAAVAQQLHRPVLVGASLGGLSSLLAIGEGRAPNASALVLVDVAPRLEAQGVGRIRDFMAMGVEGFESHGRR